MAKMYSVYRVGNEVTLRYAPNGDAILNLSLAYNYGKKGADDKKPTQWVDAVLFGKRAENLSKHIAKGDQIFAELRDVHIETYEGRNGPGHKLAAIIDDVELIGGRRDGTAAQQERGMAGAGGGNNGQQTARKPAGDSNPGDFEDDIPF